MQKGLIQYPGMPAEERQFYKAALHTHSTSSDGKFTPDQVIDLYKKAGYDVLAFTDHEVVNPVSKLDGKGMTLICGVELHPRGPYNERWHILSLNIPEDFKNVYPATGQEAVNSVVAAHGMAFVAHPHWCGFTSEEVLSLKGISGIEVFNTSCRYIGKEYNMQVWDEIMEAGFPFPALAVDDMHSEQDLFRGWTMIASKSNSVKDLMDALKQGMFYATEGPEFKSIRVHDGIFEAEFSPCCNAILVGSRNRGYCGACEDPNGPGTTKTITGFKLELEKAPRGFFRCQIRNAEGKHAWSNPIFNPVR